MLVPKVDQQVRFEPQYIDWVSWIERPPCERMFCYLLIRDLFFLFLLVAATARCASRGFMGTLGAFYSLALLRKESQHYLPNVDISFI